jgi:hypothetical protein
LAIASLSLAGTAAYFSVFGLSKLFYAAGWGMIILASSLEFSKLVTVSYVYRFWKDIKKSLRAFYIFAVVFIMLLTSIGIYGFLTGAYQQSANRLEMRDSQIQIAENKRLVFVNQLDRINSSIESSSERINVLAGLRTQQERRIDTLYSRNLITTARRTETLIEGSDDQIVTLNQEISDKMVQINSVNDSIAFYDQKIIDLKNSEVSNEIGPYKFVADLTGVSINRVVNIVAILIILVFDPLAIALLIGVNQLTSTTTNSNVNDKNSNFGILKKLRSRKKKVSEEVLEDDLNESKTTVDVITTTTTSTTLVPTTTTTTTVEQSTTTTTTTILEPVNIVDDMSSNRYIDFFRNDNLDSNKQDDNNKVASIFSKINLAHFVPNK